MSSPITYTPYKNSNTFKNECQTITDNIRKCIFSDVKEHTFSFIENRQQFMLLNVHCEDEVRKIQSEVNRHGMALKYKIVYNTQQPYYIINDKSQRQIIISQHTFL
jgi:hypothetical protein